MGARRSVRAFSPDPVPVELVRNAVATAATAPSAHRQPWTFVQVTDPDVRAAIRLAAEAEERRSYAGRRGPERLAALNPLGTSWHKPHLQVVFAQAHGSTRPAGGASTTTWPSPSASPAACCWHRCTWPVSARKPLEQVLVTV